MVCYVDLPEGCDSLATYIASLMALFRRHSAVIEVLLCNIVEFHSAMLWEKLPAGWGAALTALDLEDLVCLASPETPLPPAAMANWPVELVNYVTEALRLALPRHRSQHAPSADGDGAAVAAAAVRPSAACPFIPSEQELTSSGVEVAPAHSAQRQLLRHIKPKKRHELQRLSSVISETCKSDDQSQERKHARKPTVIDIGCGQGYLARMLTYMHGIDVVGVEAAQTNTDTAAEKASRLQYEVQKKALQQRGMQRPPAVHADISCVPVEDQAGQAGQVGQVGELRFLNRLICSERDISAIVGEVAAADPAVATPATDPAASIISVTAVDATSTDLGEGERPQRDLVEPLAKRQRPAPGGVCRSCSITGLHACGILTPQILRAYATCPTISSVVAVGCCYHKGGGGSLPLPAVLEEWGADRQSWKGDGAVAQQATSASVLYGDVDTAAASVSMSTDRWAATVTETFPMSVAIRTHLETDVSVSARIEESEGAGPPTSGVSRWLGSAQSRELACHALEQYTRRPWRHSTLLVKTMDGMHAGEDVPGLASLRASCAADTAYLKHQCYRAVLELELRPRGVSPRVAVGSVKRMERLTFEEYAQKAAQKLQKAKVLQEQRQFVLSRDYAPVRPLLQLTALCSPACRCVCNVGLHGLCTPVVRQFNRVGLPRLYVAYGTWFAYTLVHMQELANWKGFIAFYALRLCLAPLLESIILVDRLHFLTEQSGQIEQDNTAEEGSIPDAPSFDAAAEALSIEAGQDCALLPIFEPSLSPRNFALVARKRMLS